MSERPTTTQRLEGPRWLIAGRWRRRLLIARVATAVAPLAVATLATGAAWLELGPIVAAAPLGATAAVLATPPGSRWLAVRWWLLRWHWDARAAGLSLAAEPDMFAGTDGPLDRRLVVAPAVRVTAHGNGSRSYRCRPLPGQTPADYAAAVPRLVTRWAVASVVVEHQPGARHVLLHVHQSAPSADTYTRT